MTAPKTIGANSGLLRNNGVIHVTCGNENHQRGLIFAKTDALDAKQLYEALGAGMNELYLLCDIRKLKKTDNDARYVLPPPHTKRLAILVKSPVSRMLGNAYLGFGAPACPTRLFTQERLAIDWLVSEMHDS